MQKPQDFHIAAKIWLYPTERSGRNINIRSYYGCLLKFADGIEGFHDCRLYFDEPLEIAPGMEGLVSIVFLLPNLIFDKIVIGQKFFLFEGAEHPQGEGEIVGLAFESSAETMHLNTSS